MDILACTIIGHKPTRFKFKYKENYSLCKKIKSAMTGQFQILSISAALWESVCGPVNCFSA